MTAVGPGTGLQVTPRDRRDGNADGSDRRSPTGYPAAEISVSRREDGASRMARALAVILGDQPGGSIEGDRTHEAA